MTRHVFAPAKINLSLRVGAPGTGGRHPLDSLVCFTTTCGDTLTLEADEGLRLQIEGPFAHGLDVGEDNLVLRAARLLRDVTGAKSGASMVLDKRLPIASGIGGGSADAAAALMGLNDLWGCGLDQGQLQHLSANLGADVPACVFGGSLHMTGTGEAIEAIAPLPKLGIVLVNPLIACPTGTVFRHYDLLGNFSPMTPNALPDVSTRVALLAYLRATPNDLEPPAIALVSEIGMVLAAIARSPNALLARMSGSGATCFGLYENGADAKVAAHFIKNALASFPVWVEADVIT